MNKVSDLVSTLSAEEIKKLSGAKWSPRERELLDAILQSVSTKKNPALVSAESMSISKSHFDKLSSVVTEKIYNRLTNGSFKEIVFLLQQKGLSDVLLHEIGLQERKLKNEKDKAVHKDFYLIAYERLRRTPFDKLDLKMLRQYANKLKPFLKDGQPFSATVLEYKYVYVENAFHFLNGESLAYAPKALANIQRIAPVPDKQGKPEQSYYHFCMAGYMKDFPDDQNKALEHAKQALELARQWAPGKDDNFLASAYGMVATIHAHRSQFKEALAIHIESFEKLPEHMTTNFYHVIMFACILTVCREYKLLEQHLDKHMSAYLDGSAALYYRLETMRIKALLLLYQKKYDEALHIIRELQSVKRKDMTDTADVFLRMIDNLYFLLTGDYAQTISQSTKNLKYLRRKNYTYDNCDYNHFFYTIGALAKMKQKGKVKPEALEPHLSRSRLGFLQMYSGLFEQVM